MDGDDERLASPKAFCAKCLAQGTPAKLIANSDTVQMIRVRAETLSLQIVTELVHSVSVLFKKRLLGT